jgi:hypothetical protein
LDCGAALNGIRFVVTLQPRQVAALHGDEEGSTHRFQVDADRNSVEQVRPELRRLGLGQSLENRIRQMRQPLGPTQLDREPRMVVLVERAADETTAAGLAVETEPLHDLIGRAMLGETLDVLGLDGRIVEVREHDEVLSQCQLNNQ